MDTAPAAAVGEATEVAFLNSLLFLGNASGGSSESAASGNGSVSILNDVDCEVKTSSVKKRSGRPRGSTLERGSAKSSIKWDNGQFLGSRAMCTR